MSVDYCTLDDALIIVERLGVHVRDIGLLSSALERPRTDVFGLDAYPDLHSKAGALLDAVNRAHPLDDGNKRLSWLITVLFYDRNGFDSYASADDGEEFVLRAAGEHLALDQIAAWLAAHVTRLSG